MSPLDHCYKQRMYQEHAQQQPDEYYNIHYTTGSATTSEPIYASITTSHSPWTGVTGVGMAANLAIQQQQNIYVSSNTGTSCHYSNNPFTTTGTNDSVIVTPNHFINYPEHANIVLTNWENNRLNRTFENVEQDRKHFEETFVPKNPITFTKLPPFEIKGAYAQVRHCDICNCNFWFNGEFNNSRYNLPWCSRECASKYHPNYTKRPSLKVINRAKRKANRLLRTWLSKAEYNYLQEHDELELPSKYEQDVIYIVKKDPLSKVQKKVKGVVKEHLCITLLNSGFQRDDSLLSKILLIKGNEKQFLKIANSYPVGNNYTEPEVQTIPDDHIRQRIMETAEVVRERYPEIYEQADRRMREENPELYERYGNVVFGGVDVERGHRNEVLGVDIPAAPNVERMRSLLETT